MIEQHLELSSSSIFMIAASPRSVGCEADDKQIPAMTAESTGTRSRCVDAAPLGYHAVSELLDRFCGRMDPIK